MNEADKNENSPQRPPKPPDAADSEASDEQLMLLFSKGSGEAFTVLFHRFKQPVYGFFRRRLQDAAQAEELTQETFIVLLRTGSRYEPRALFRTFLYGITFKILRAYRRKWAFRATFFGRPNSAAEPGRRDATESSLAVRRAIEKLERTDREILLLREFEQLSYAEISDLLGLPLNTVRSRLFRSRQALRELLETSPSSNAGNSKQNSVKKGDRG